MIGGDFNGAKARVGRVMDFIRDTMADASIGEPAGRGAGYSIEYDETSIEAKIWEVLVGVALHGEPDPTPAEKPADVVAIIWESSCYRVRATVGMEMPAEFREVAWIMRNGQEVRVRWKVAFGG